MASRANNRVVLLEATNIYIYNSDTIYTIFVGKNASLFLDGYRKKCNNDHLDLKSLISVPETGMDFSWCLDARRCSML
jgi:hypothetical protein